MARARWIGFGGAIGTCALVACASLTGADDLRVTGAGDGGLSGSSSGQTDGPITLPDGNVIFRDAGTLTPPAPGVICNGASCDGHCCAAQGASGLRAICLAANQACTGDAGGGPGLAIDLYCDESADCASGSACCSGESFTVQCRPPKDCVGSFLYMCGSDKDCPPVDGGTAGACMPVPPGESPYPFGKGVCLVDDD